jgi:hypothetical protein
MAEPLPCTQFILSKYIIAGGSTDAQLEGWSSLIGKAFHAYITRERTLVQ